MKKIMEKRFMFVGTLEEAEFNRVVSVSGTDVRTRSDGRYCSLQEGIGIMVRYVLNLSAPM
jgi:hypothetical protein